MTIGDDVTLGSFVMIMDSDFHVAGDREAAPGPEPVSIGARSTIGHRSVVLPGARIGSGVVVEPASAVACAVPDGAWCAATRRCPSSAAPTWASDRWPG